jgi:hypothetical protein
MQINREAVSVCIVGMAVYKRIVVLIFLIAFKLFYLFFLKMHILTWRSMLVYLFIYLLFGSLLAPSFHSCCPRVFFFFFLLLTWGAFGEGFNACSACGVMGLRWDSCYSLLTSLGPLSYLLKWDLAPWVMGEGHC